MHEVEVYGNDLGKQNANSIGNSSSQAAKEVVVPKGLANFNAFGWMDRRGNRDRRHQKKAQNVISELDSQQQESSGDPILEAFHQQQAIKAAADKAKLEALEKAREKQAAETDQKKMETLIGLNLLPKVRYSFNFQFSTLNFYMFVWFIHLIIISLQHSTYYV